MSWTIKRFLIDVNKITIIELPRTGVFPRFLKATFHPQTHEACVWVLYDKGDELAVPALTDKFRIKSVLSENDCTPYVHWTYIDTIYEPETHENFAWTWHLFVSAESDDIALESYA